MADPGDVPDADAVVLPSHGEQYDPDLLHQRDKRPGGRRLFLSAGHDTQRTGGYRVGAIMQTTWVLLFIGTLLFGKYVLKKDNVCPIFLADNKKAAS